MHRLIIVLLLALLPATETAAQSGAIKVYCAACRDPLRYPDDWANFAFNQVYGDRAWMTFDQADDFYVFYSGGDRVYVDVDFVMHSFRFLGIDLPVWPRYLLSIELALPNGKVVRYLRSVFQHPLPVPSPAPPRNNRGSSSRGGDEGGDDGVDDEHFDDGEPIEWPETDYSGRVDIVDPDEDGEFPGTDWCEEC
jgi:hypothetical protein